MRMCCFLFVVLDLNKIKGEIGTESIPGVFVMCRLKYIFFSTHRSSSGQTTLACRYDLSSTSLFYFSLLHLAIVCFLPDTRTSLYSLPILIGMLIQVTLDFSHWTLFSSAHFLNGSVPDKSWRWVIGVFLWEKRVYCWWERVSHQSYRGIFILLE